MKLSRYFSLDELTYSVTAAKLGIDNTPHGDELVNLGKLCTDVLDKIRCTLGVPVLVSSGYRCGKLNDIKHGSATSQHCFGEAADIYVTGKLKNRDLFNCIIDLIKAGEIRCGQVIWEYGNDDNPDWVHVSLPYRKTNQILRACRKNGEIIYKDISYILD